MKICKSLQIDICNINLQNVLSVQIYNAIIPTELSQQATQVIDIALIVLSANLKLICRISV